MNFLQKINIKVSTIWQWFLRRPWRFIFIVLFFLLVFSITNGRGNGYEEIPIEKRDLSRTVLSSGEVVSSVDLSLSFPKSGVVKDINVKVGDKVEKDQVLAMISQGTLNAQVTEALGSLRLAQARLQKVVEGATSEEIKITEVSLQTAKDKLSEVKKEQETLVLNARRILNSGDLEAIPESNSASLIAVYLTGSYNAKEVGKFYLSRTINNYNWVLSGPLRLEGSISELTPDPVGDTGLYISFSTRYLAPDDSWTIEIPNTKGVNYPRNKSSYDAAVASASSMISAAENDVLQKEAELILKKKEARPSEILAAEAEVLQAQGRFQSAKAQIEDTLLKAPEAGTITSVNIKTGELSEVQNVAMVLENTESLYVESNINEANIDLIYKNAPADIAFDAFPGKVYAGKIAFVEPSETLIGGVVNYKVNADILELDANVRPGLTANLITTIWKSEGVLAIPERAIYSKDGKYYVLLKTGKKSKNNQEVEIRKGRTGDGAIAEIESGLSAGDIVLVKKE